MPTFSPQIPENIQSLLREADYKHKSGDQLAAIPLYEKACTLLAQATSDNETLAQALDKIGDAYRDMGNKTKAQEYYRKVLNLTNAFGENYLILRQVTQGKSFHISEHYELALEQYLTVLNKLEKQYDKKSVNIVSILNKIGDLYRDEKKFDLARDTHARALSILENSEPTNEASLASTLRKLGSIAQQLGQFEPAKKLYLKALEIKNKNPANTVSTINLLNALGSLAYQMEDDVAAKKHLATSLSIISDHYNTTPNRYTANACLWLSKVEERLGNTDEAAKLLSKATAAKVKCNSPRNGTAVQSAHSFWKNSKVIVATIVVAASAAAALTYRS